MRKIKLGEVLDVKRGASLSGDYYSKEGTLIRLTLGNFNYPGGGFKQNTSKEDLYYNGPVRDEFIMEEGDIITPLTEQVRGLLGETAIIPESDKYVQSGDIGKIIPVDKLLDKDFAPYLISSPVVKRQLDTASQQTKIRHTSPDKIKDCIAWIPKIDDQKQIGQLLKNIDNKIKNNKEVNYVLESLAKTLYDYWFLQFEFPNEEGKPYKSSGGKMVWNEELKREIPEGWETIRFGDITSFTKGKIPQYELTPTKNDLNDSPYITIDVANDALPMFCCSKSMIPVNGETIMVMDGAASGDVYIGNKGILGSTFSKISSIRNDISDAFLYMLLKGNSAIYKKANTGSTVPHANTNFIKAMKIALPKDCSRTSKEFEKIVNTIVNNRIQNQQLSSLRDWLLPMLMNGQATFKDEE